jgi:glycosyltransferase involved in cell wall biosynthesis
MEGGFDAVRAGVHGLEKGLGLCVVVPVFNEVATVEEVLRSVLAQPVVAEVVVVDDGSRDGTAEVLERVAAGDSRVKLLRYAQNRGKGAAVRVGISKATAPIVIIQDADLEYDPVEYPAMIGPIVRGKADAVFGSRFIGSQEHRVLYFWHSIGNRFLTLLSNAFTNLNLTDMETCFKAFRREIVQSLDLREERFGFEPEVTAKLARRGARIYEVAISYHGRTYAEGKKIRWTDGVAALGCILKYGLGLR